MLKTILHKIKYIIISIVVIYMIIILYSMRSLHQTAIKDDPKLNQLINNDNKASNQSYSMEVVKPQESETENKSDTLNWIEVTPDLYVLQAYLDLRKENEHFIRFLTLIRKTREKDISVACTFDSDNISYHAAQYEFNENHAMEFGGYIHSCNINKIDHKFVHLSERNSRRSVRLKLQILKSTEGNKIHNFSICVPPLDGNISPQRLASFIEMNILMGANHFYLYNYQLESNLDNLINFYSKKRLLTVRKWTVPSTNIWYKGQMTNIHHCLYETIGKSKYTIFQDIDELVVPLVSDNWTHLMNEMDKGQHCGFKISSVFFSPLDDPFVYFKSTKRSKLVNNFRSKCIVRPELIFEQGIHHISKQNVEKFTPKSADSSKVLLFHYRMCDSMFGFDCSQQITDQTMNRHHKRFADNFNKNVNLL